MKKRILLLTILLSAINSFSQNSYGLIEEKVNAQLELDNYRKAKQEWLQIEKSIDVDPSEKYLFLMEALDNNDVKFFKHEIKKLILKSGWNYAVFDTSHQVKVDDPYMELIHTKGLSEWLLKKSQNLHPKWIKKHSIEFAIQQKVNLVYNQDQYAIQCLASFTDYSCSPCDSSQEAINGYLLELNRQHLQELIDLANSYGVFPNSFDHGYGVSNLFEIILWHNLKVKSNFKEAWESVFPYLSVLYKQGKLRTDIFRMHDDLATLYFGYQTFGFAPESTPYLDAEKSNQIKKELGL